MEPFIRVRNPASNLFNRFPVDSDKNWFVEWFAIVQNCTKYYALRALYLFDHEVVTTSQMTHKLKVGKKVLGRHGQKWVWPVWSQDFKNE